MHFKIKKNEFEKILTIYIKFGYYFKVMKNKIKYGVLLHFNNFKQIK